MFAETIDDLPSLETALSLTGLEFMQGILDGSLPAPPISRPLGYALHTVEKGRVAFRGTPQFDVMNPMGSVHGGWYGTLLDSAMACAVMTTLPAGQIYTTLEYKVNLIRSVPPGVEVECTGLVAHTGRSTAVATGEIRGVSDGRLHATGSTTCIVMTPRG